VVQLYAGHPAVSVTRPPRELRAFAKVRVEAGATADVGLSLGMRDLAHWDPPAGAWVAEAGEHLLWVGTSSRDLADPITVVLTEPWSAPASARLDGR
jgi:beta-glucosidase